MAAEVLQKDDAGKIPGATICGTIAFVFAMTAEELLGYHSLTISLPAFSFAVPFYTVMLVVQCIVAFVIFLLPTGSWSMMGSKAFGYLFIAMAVVGTVADLLAGVFETGGILTCVGYVVLAICDLFLKIMLLEFFSSISMRWTKSMLFIAALAQSFFAPIFMVQDTSLWWILVFVFLVLGFAFARVAWKGRSVLASGGREQYHKETGFSPKVLFGLGMIFLSITYLSPWILFDSASPEIFIAFSFSTHLIAALLFALFILRPADAAYALTFKVIDSLVLVSFILFAVITAPAFLPRFISTVTLSLLEIVTFFAAADLASYSTVSPLRLFSGYYLLMRGFVLLGTLLTVVDNQFFDFGTSYSVVGIILALLMAITAIWLMNDRNIFEFLWGTPTYVNPDAEGGVSNATAEAADADMKVDTIAERYALSPREKDVLRLFSQGRSSTFIAEQFCVSNNTIRKHVASIYQKCGVHSKQELLTLIQSV